MTATYNHLPASVANRLRRFERTRRRRRLTRLAWSALALYGALLLTAIHLDRFLFLETGARYGLLLAVHGLTAAWILGGLAAMWLRRPNARAVAYAFEASLEHDAGERYVTLENVLGRADAPLSDVQRQLLEQLKDGTEQHAEREARPRRVRDRALQWSLGAAVAVMLATLALVMTPASQFPLMIRRFYRPDHPLPKPSFLRLEVVPARPVIGRGDDLALQVAVRGRMPRLFEWLYRKAGHGPSRSVISIRPGPAERFLFAEGTPIEMSRIQRDLFLYAQSGLMSNISFAVRCGDAQTAVHTVEVVAQPVVTAIEVAITPPAYAAAAGLEAQTVTDIDQPLQALARSEIMIRFKTDQPVPRREIRFDQDPDPHPHRWDEQKRQGEFSFLLRDSTTVEITVANAAGFANRERVRVSITMRVDAEPVVELLQPAPESNAVAGDLVPVQTRMDDDLGIATAALQFWVNPSPEREMAMKEIPAPWDGGPVTGTNLVMALDLEQIGATPGDEVLVRVRARDVAGQDGFSRDARIRVLPFTRDENERQRLRALSFVRAALSEMAAGEGAGAPLSGAAAERLRNAAAHHAVAPAQWTSWAPLLRLLEREHHVTDRPRHKDDLRLLRTLLWRVLASDANPARSNGELPDNLDFDFLGRELLPDLYRLRRAKNITWRLYGLRAETARLESVLTQTTGPPSPSMDRRLQLYLAAVQDLNEELADLNREVSWIDEDALLERMREMNENAYYVRRGTPARRLDACRRLHERFDQTLRLLHPTYPRMLEAELAARERLRHGYHRILAEAVSGEPARDRATAWLTEDGRLMAYNPFLPIWPRALNLALRAGRDVQSAWRPDAALTDIVDRDARRLRRLAFAWENRAVLDESIGNTEKALQLTLSMLEEDAADGRETVAARQALDALDVTADMDDAAFSALELRDTGPVPAPPPAGDPDAPAARVRELDLLPDPLEAIRATLTQWQSRTAVLEAIGEAGATDHDPDDATETASEPAGLTVAALVRDDLNAMQALSELVEMRLRCEPPRTALHREERLLVDVREALHRYRTAAQPVLDTLETAAETRATDDPGRTAAETGRLMTLRHRAFIRLETNAVALAQGDAVTTDEPGGHPILRGYALTRNLRSALARMAEPDAPRDEIIAALRERHPELALGYLAEGRIHVIRARAAVRAAQAAIEQSPPDPTEAGERINEGADALLALRRHLDRATESHLRDQASRTVDPLSRQMTSLATFGEEMTTETISRNVYILGELTRELMSLDVILRPAAQGMIEAFELSGGPFGGWAPAHQRSAERSQQRIERQIELALQRANPVLDDATDPAAAIETASAWAAFAFGTARSALNTARGMRVGARIEPDHADPLLQYLREEAIRARSMPNLRHYAEPVNRYLEGFYDFLRY